MSGVLPTTDIRIVDQNGDNLTYGYMLAPGPIMQDITPSSVRRSDGDTRFLTIQTEGYSAQTDFSGGHGLLDGADPASYWSGPMDTTGGAWVNCPSDGFDLTSPGTVFNLWIEDSGTYSGNIYAWYASGTTYVVGRYSGGTWTVVYTFPTTPGNPLTMTRFRGKSYFAFGPDADVRWVDGGGAVGTIAGFRAYRLTPYGSMLYGAHVETGATSPYLNRWDPENNNVQIVGRFPEGSALPTDILAAYGQLYVLFTNSLWSWTSQNGTVGVLQGPLDRFQAPVEVPNWSSKDGQARLVAWNGALIYANSAVLRTYTPGGAARQLFPVLPRLGYGAPSWNRLVTGLAVSNGNLYVMLEPIGNSGTGVVSASIQQWTGSGMVEVYAPSRTFATGFAWGQNYVFRAGGDYGLLCSLGARSSQSVLVQLKVASYAGQMMYEAQSGLFVKFATGTLTSAWRDFGLRDVLKSLHVFRVSGILPTYTGNIQLYYMVDNNTTWTEAAIIAGAFPRYAGSSVEFRPQVVTFSPASNAYLTFKRLRWRLVLTPGYQRGTPGANDASPLVDAVILEPNPVMPLKNGFRITIRLGVDVHDYTSQPLYPDSGAVQAAYARVMAFRTSTGGLPLALAWLDNQVYYVRANTRQVRRLAQSRADGPSWEITFDLQEVS